MSDLLPFKDRTLMKDREQTDIDSLLRKFFRSEMPEPWPNAPQVKEKKQTGARSPLWWRNARPRLALAASVAIFVLGYWSLSQVFPTVLPSPFGLNSRGQTAREHDRPGVLVAPVPMPETAPADQGVFKVIPTPSGGARVIENQQGNRKFIRVEALPLP